MNLEKLLPGAVGEGGVLHSPERASDSPEEHSQQVGSSNEAGVSGSVPDFPS